MFWTETLDLFFRNDCGELATNTLVKAGSRLSLDIIDDQEATIADELTEVSTRFIAERRERFRSGPIEKGLCKDSIRIGGGIDGILDLNGCRLRNFYEPSLSGRRPRIPVAIVFQARNCKAIHLAKRKCRAPYRIQCAEGAQLPKDPSARK